MQNRTQYLPGGGSGRLNWIRQTGMLGTFPLHDSGTFLFFYHVNAFPPQKVLFTSKF